MAADVRRAGSTRCGQITNPGAPYPLPCVRPKGHDGSCDPHPKVVKTVVGIPQEIIARFDDEFVPTCDTEGS